MKTSQRMKEGCRTIEFCEVDHSMTSPGSSKVKRLRDRIPNG